MPRNENFHKQKEKLGEMMTKLHYQIMEYLWNKYHVIHTKEIDWNSITSIGRKVKIDKNAKVTPTAHKKTARNSMSNVETCPISTSSSTNDLVVKQQNAIQKVPNPLLMRRPLKERLIHMLAVKPYKKPELYSVINRDGIRDSDRNHLMPTLIAISYIRDNTYHLLRHMWNDVQEDWPFYTEQDRQQMKRCKPQNLTPDGSDSGISVGSNQSPKSSMMDDRMTLVSSSDQTQYATAKRPGYFHGVDGFQTKRQRISHYQRKDTRDFKSANTVLIKPSNQDEEILHMSHSTYCFDDVIERNGLNRSSSIKTPTRYTNDNDNNQDKNKSGNAAAAAAALRFANLSCKQPSSKGRMLPSSGSVSCAADTFSSSNSFMQENVSQENVNNRMYNSFNANEIIETSASASNIKHRTRTRSNFLLSTSKCTNTASANVAKSTTFMPLPSPLPAVAKMPPRFLPPPIPTVEVTPPSRLHISPEYRAGDIGADAVATTSSSSMCHLSVTNRNSGVSVGRNTSLQKPKYMRDYVKITNLVQRRKYKDDFNVNYNEYKKLHNMIENVTQTFVTLREQLKQSEENPTKHKAIETEIYDKYVEMKTNNHYEAAKIRVEYLHDKLSHIKNLVHEYDETLL